MELLYKEDAQKKVVKKSLKHKDKDKDLPSLKNLSYEEKLQN